jgi:hypothetical protein
MLRCSYDASVPETQMEKDNSCETDTMLLDGYISSIRKYGAALGCPPMCEWQSIQAEVSAPADTQQLQVIAIALQDWGCPGLGPSCVGPCETLGMAERAFVEGGG